MSFSALLNVVADAEGPKKGGKPPRPGLNRDIPTSNAGENSRMLQENVSISYQKSSFG